MAKPKQKAVTVRAEITRDEYEQKMLKELIEFGYPSTTKEMIHEITDAYAAGKRGHDLPHFVIGLFCERWCKEAIEAGILTA